MVAEASVSLLLALSGSSFSEALRAETYTSGKPRLEQGLGVPQSEV